MSVVVGVNNDKGKNYKVDIANGFELQFMELEIERSRVFSAAAKIWSLATGRAFSADKTASKVMRDMLNKDPMTVAKTNRTLAWCLMEWTRVVRLINKVKDQTSENGFDGRSYEDRLAGFKDGTFKSGYEKKEGVEQSEEDKAGEEFFNWHMKRLVDAGITREDMTPGRIQESEMMIDTFCAKGTRRTDFDEPKKMVKLAYPDAHATSDNVEKYYTVWASFDRHRPRVLAKAAGERNAWKAACEFVKEEEYAKIVKEAHDLYGSEDGDVPCGPGGAGAGTEADTSQVAGEGDAGAEERV